MLPLLQLLVFILALSAILLSIINAIKKDKDPSLKLRWILIPLLFSFFSLVLNFFVGKEISKNTYTKFDESQKEVGIVRDSLAEINGELNAINPPLPEKLRRLLVSIDPKILRALKNDTTRFERQVSLLQYADLQRIVLEDSTNRYITMSRPTAPSWGLDFQQGEGEMYIVKFTLDPRLLNE